MAQQTSYPNNPPAAINGLVAGLSTNTVIFSKVSVGTVPIGCLAIPGAQSMSVPAPLVSTSASGDSGTVAPFGAGIVDNPLLDSEFIGIPIYDAGLMQTSQMTAVGSGANAFTAYLTQMPVPVLRKGKIWVLTEGAVSNYGNVFVRVVADGIHQLGQFSGSAGAGFATFSHGRWLMSLATQGLALMEVW